MTIAIAAIGGGILGGLIIGVIITGLLAAVYGRTG